MILSKTFFCQHSSGSLCHDNSGVATSQYSGIIAMIIVGLFCLNNNSPPNPTLTTCLQLFIQVWLHDKTIIMGNHGNYPLY